MVKLLPLLCRNRRGVAVTEFALVLPPLTLLLFGIFGYGQYFLLAHSVQQIANDAARATIAGLSTSERKSLAEGLVNSHIAELPNVEPDQYLVDVDEPGNLVVVTVTLDSSVNSFLNTTLVPMPDSLIKRSGVVRQGGIE